MFTIRPFNPTDAEYEAIAALAKAVWVYDSPTAADYKHRDAGWDANYLFQRLVVEENGRLLAVANYNQTPWSYLPGKYQWGIAVHPDHERRGIGSAVYEHIQQVLQQQEPAPTLLVTGTREDKPQSMRFLEKRGYQSTMRWLVSELDVSQFEPARFAGLRQKLADEGIVIRVLPEQIEMDPHWQREIYDLDWQLTLDEPSPQPPTRLPFEQYVHDFIEAHTVIMEAWWVALHNGRYIGMTQLNRDQHNPNGFETGFTGTLRDYRRRGIATALKAIAIEYAQQKGATAILTGNEENNPMYQINVKLGFRPKTADLAYEKKFGD
ncbi:MAG: GNAT family N-acetyltransferase [Ardenticatenaceae bacterium]|nr:GNAT family N-acetyltransferase [Ardenticatenaceae bacterium]